VAGLSPARLVPCLAHNLSATRAKYARVARALGIDEKDDEVAAIKGIEKIRDISLQIGLPKFSALGISPDDFHKLAEMSFKNGSNNSNPKPMTLDDYEALFHKIHADR